MPRAPRRVFPDSGGLANGQPASLWFGHRGHGGPDLLCREFSEWGRPNDLYLKEQIAMSALLESQPNFT